MDGAVREVSAKQLIAGWSLTKRCNLRCIHCYNNSGCAEKDELSTQEALGVVQKLKDANVAAVNFGGGECALRPDFMMICRALYDAGIKVSYTTNGTTYPVLKDHLYLFHDIGVSIDFADSAMHDWFRGRKGTYAAAYAMLKNLVQQGVETEMVTCLTRLNAKEQELRKLYTLGKNIGIQSWRLNRFRATGRGLSHSHELDLTPELLREAYAFLSTYIAKDAIVAEPLFRAGFWGNYSIRGDPSGTYAFRIRPDGKVSPSVFLQINGGNIKQQSLQEIFDSSLFRHTMERKPEGKCLACKEYEHCQGGDVGASYLAYRHFNGPDPLCWINPATVKEKPPAKKIIKDDWNVHERYLCTLYIDM